MFVDTHAHLYLDQFKEDIELLVELCQEADVRHVYLPNIDSKTIAALYELSDNYPEMMHPMMGIHPCSIAENFEFELKKAEQQLRERTFAAVGEIGIDLYWDKTFAKEQEMAFIRQIEWAKDLHIPFVIHSRDSLDLTIKIVEDMQDGSLRGIFHCFNGSEEQGKRIADMGFMIGIGGVITFKNAGVREEVAKLSIENMVLETDAPYLSPTPFRGRRNQSNYIPIIADQLAESLEMELERVEEITTKNAFKLFGTPNLAEPSS